jgi:transcriptional regulator with XRE-family HTH domain
MIGVHYLQISQYETGSYFPTVGKLLDIAKALQVSMDVLFGEIVPDEKQVSNLRLLRRFRDLETLSQRRSGDRHQAHRRTHHQGQAQEACQLIQNFTSAMRAHVHRVS